MSDTYIQKYGKKIAARDGMTCHYCGCQLYDGKDVHKIARENNWSNDLRRDIFLVIATVDHVIPRAKGGSDDLENLVLACHKCNLDKGAK